MAKQRVVLIVRDGWGIGAPGKYNAVTTAKTPNVSGWLGKYPYSVLEASGEFVGLPAGFMGSSEVGHLNMGAGRIVVQELKKLMDAAADGSLFSAPAFKACIDNCLKTGGALHLMGLVQDEGVHAHQEHLFAIMRHAAGRGVKNINIHFFADGRDTPPRSALAYVKTVEAKIRETGAGRIATVIGRYYAMDRSEKWELVDRAYDCIALAAGERAATAEEAVTRAYSGKNPDGSPLVDEYVPPTVIGGYSGVKDGDSVVHFNFRQDRAIELTKAFVEDEYPGKRAVKLNVAYCGLTRYYDTFKFSALPPMDEDASMSNLLGEVIGKRGLRQLRLAETQKFKHVTSFFNGKMLRPYPGEDRIEIKGTFDPATYAEHPEMNAPEVCAEAEKQIRSCAYDFVLVNFANCDMVGHTGNFGAAVRAVEIVDDCAGRLVRAALETGAAAIVTADHGNAEEMWDAALDMPKTAHTCNPVECILIRGGAPTRLRPKGILGDIAPTVLELLGIAPPPEMTARTLIAAPCAISG
ncbi:MAG: 2,3-bisphosphoglycerate-independent phosphoglycerate mutase [Elusimicrobiales bacterium]